MSNENRNNTIKWKSKLDELDSLPGETLPDKNAMWEKLHGRIDGRKNIRKIFWYRAAAACLLIALMIPGMLSRKIKNNIVQYKVLPIQIKGPAIHEELYLKKKDTIAAISSAPVEKKSALKIEVNNNRNAIADSNKERIESKDQIVVDQISSVIVTDSPVLSIALMPLKKKLKVVHINELGDPVEVSPDVANRKDLHSFQLKLATQEVYINPAVAFNKNGFTILKTKSSPN